MKVGLFVANTNKKYMIGSHRVKHVLWLHVVTSHYQLS